MNFELFPETHAAATVASHPAVQHIAKCALKIVPHLIGVSTMTCVISVMAAAAVAGVVGYFVGKRGLTGVKTDLTNAETKVSQVATEVKTAVAPAPVA